VTASHQWLLHRVLSYSLSEGVPLCSFKVALVVGTLLNLINQGDALLGHAQLDWKKLLLTYLVPYGVSTYGAVAAHLRYERKLRSEK
jgi:hypothetical protein